jgi:type II secretory pathway pseudopilin PulG
MIVVAVMSILVAVAIPVYRGVSKTQRLNDCTMNRQMISVVIQEAMNGMLDNCKKQKVINMDKASHKTTFPTAVDGKVIDDDYAGRDCFLLEYEASADANTAFTLGDIRGGYRTSGDYAAGCEEGNFLKRSNLANVKMYTKLANQEIPQCAFEESDNAEYHYYIFDDATVLCDCPECLDNLGLLGESVTEN